MDFAKYVTVLSLLFCFTPRIISESIIQIPTPSNSHLASASILISGRHHHHHRKSLRDDNLYCDSWRFTVEANDAGFWSQIPARCEGFVKDYMTGDRYRADSKMVAEDGLEFARTVDIAGHGKGEAAGVFDVDEALLSNIPYYAAHGFGGPLDQGKPATAYKSEKRMELEDEGFTIYGSSGDQWSDLVGYAVAKRSFKLPNPMYYIA